MKYNTEDIFKKIKDIKLTEAEKSSILRAISDFAEKNQISSVMEQGNGRHHTMSGPWSWPVSIISINYQRMTLALIIILALTGGTSLAAQGALPGDALYPVKIHLNEKIESALTVGAEADARVEAKHALLRLQEAETLAANGRLDDETRAEVKERFESETNAFDNRIQELKEEGNLKAVVDVSGDFEADLGKHLEAIVSLSGTNPKQKPFIVDVADSIKTEASASAKNRIEAEGNRVEVSGKTEAKAAAEGVLNAALNKIEEVRKFFGEFSGKVSAEIKAKAEAELKVANDLIVQGKAKFEAGNYGDAFSYFKKAAYTAEDAKLLYIFDIRANTKEPEQGDQSSKIEGSGEVKNESNTNDDTKLDADVHSDTIININGSNIDSSGKVKVKIGW